MPFIPGDEFAKIQCEAIWLESMVMDLLDEVKRLKQENESYALWMNRSIDRIKEMQQ